MVTENLVRGVGEGVEVALFPDPLCYKSLRYSRMMEDHSMFQAEGVALPRLL